MTPYLLALDPSKSSTGLVLIQAQPFTILRHGVLTLPKEELYTRDYSPALLNITLTLQKLCDEFHLSGSNTTLLIENLFLGRNTMPLLYYIFQGIIQWSFAYNPINTYTFLPMTIKSFIKALYPQCPIGGILQKEHILQIYRALETLLQRNPFPLDDFNDDVLDAYFLMLLGTFIDNGKWGTPSLSVLSSGLSLVSPFNLPQVQKLVTRKIARTYDLSVKSRFSFPLYDAFALRERVLSGETPEELGTPRHIREVLSKVSDGNITVSFNSKGYFLTTYPHPIYRK